MELLEQIKVVAETRQKASELKAYKDNLMAEWNNANKELFDALTQVGADVAVAEASLRESTLKAYQETGNKSPAPGVGIREITKLDYDTKEAFSWAVDHNMALKLDELAFKKIIKATPLDFVTTTIEPQATIATDLSEYLEVTTK